MAIISDGSHLFSRFESTVKWFIHWFKYRKKLLGRFRIHSRYIYGIFYGYLRVFKIYNDSVIDHRKWQKNRRRYSPWIKLIPIFLIPLFSRRAKLFFDLDFDSHSFLFSRSVEVDYTINLVIGGILNTAETDCGLTGPPVAPNRHLSRFLPEKRLQSGLNTETTFQVEFFGSWPGTKIVNL